MLRRLSVIAAFMLVLLGSSSSAAADERKCSFDPATNSVKCVITMTPVPYKAVSLDTGGSGVRLPLEWRRWAVPLDPAMGEIGCSRADGVDVVIGAVTVTMLVNVETGAVLSIQGECIFPGDPLPEPPPPPPSLPEFLSAAKGVLVTNEQVNPNPAWGGITGVDTWLWCTDPGAVTVNVALRGWTAAATAEPVQYQWDVAGPTSASFHPTTCGSEQRPAATWQPQTKGQYTIGLSTTWAGTWALTYNGIPMGTFVLGPFDITGSPAPYPVGEYVGVLINGTAP